MPKAPRKKPPATRQRGVAGAGQGLFPSVEATCRAALFEDPKPVARIVDALGGTLAVAAWLGLSGAAVSHWKAREGTVRHGRVPSEHIEGLCALARVLRVDIGAREIVGERKVPTAWLRRLRPNGVAYAGEDLTFVEKATAIRRGDLTWKGRARDGASKTPPARRPGKGRRS